MKKVCIKELIEITVKLEIDLFQMMAGYINRRKNVF